MERMISCQNRFATVVYEYDKINVTIGSETRSLYSTFYKFSDISKTVSFKELFESLEYVKFAEHKIFVYAIINDFGYALTFPSAAPASRHEHMEGYF